MKSPPGSLEPSGGSNHDRQPHPTAWSHRLPRALESCDSGQEMNTRFFLFLSMNLQLYTLQGHVQSISVDAACQNEPPALCPDKGPSNFCTLNGGRSIPGYRFSLWSQVNGTKSEVMLIFLTLAQCYAKSRCDWPLPRLP